jgi:hypothetical protein
MVRGIDAWLQVPVHRLSFDDAGGERDKTGLGDVRLFLRLGSELLRVRLPVAVAIRGGVKLPGSDFPVDAEIIPLTEGQRDWELMLELGHSFYPVPIYAQGWVGHRWREENARADRKPGNEWFAFAAVGGQWRNFTWKFAAEGVNGGPPRTLGIRLSNDQRDFVQLLPKIGYQMGPGALEFGARIPVWGRNLLAGPALTVGYFFTFSNLFP